MICQWCNSVTLDLAEHFSGDDCPAIVTAFGPITAQGRRAEAERAAYTKALSEAEKAARRVEQREADRARRLTVKDKPCARCGVAVRVKGLSYCVVCRRSIVTASYRKACARRNGGQGVEARR